MTLGIDNTLPRWLIDDTSDITNARIFCVHTHEPRLIGELLPEDEAGLDGIQIAGFPNCQVLTRILWYDEPVFDANDLCESLREAIENHESIRYGD